MVIRCLNHLFCELQTAKYREDSSLTEYSSRGWKKKKLKIRLYPLLKAIQNLLLLPKMQAKWWSLVTKMRKTVHGVTPSPAAGEEQSHAPAQAGEQLAGKQRYRKGHGRPGGQVEHKPATCPCRKLGFQHPGLCYKGPGEQITREVILPL